MTKLFMETYQRLIGIGRWGTVRNWLNSQLLIQKLNNPMGYVLLTLVGIGIGIGVAKFDIQLSALLLVVLIGLPFLVGCIFNLKLGVATILVVSFPLLGIKKYFYSDPPLGILLDLMIFLMSFGLFVKQSREKDWSFAYHPLSLMMLIWIGYNILEFANPWAASRIVWFYTVRGMAGLTLLYFIALYAFKDLKTISAMVKLILGLAFISAGYGLYQEFFGLNTYELRWLYADEARFKLIYQWGRIRIFSFFSDPTTFGIILSYLFVFCGILMTGPFSWFKRILLGVCAIMIFMAMIYTGTRTAFAIIPIGIVFFALLTLNRFIVAGTVIFLLFGAVLMTKSTSNATLYRIQSAFKPKKDLSMQVRLDNQKMIQPFIQSHPFGAGLGATGTWGKRFSPDSALANFPPDSGFVRTAVEMGWVGLLLYCTFLFVALVTGIKAYLRVNNPKVKTFYLAFLTLIFCLTVANYPQEAIILLPNSIVFYVSLAAIVRLKDFDDKLLNEN